MSNGLERTDTGFGGFLKSMLMSNTDRANKKNRGIAEYRPTEISTLFDSNNGAYSAVISGGDQHYRTNAIVAQAKAAFDSGFPVVIIHENDNSLCYKLGNAFPGNNVYTEISPSSPCFEPFYGLEPVELANQIVETAPQSYEIKHVVRYYLDGLMSYLSAKGKHASFKMMMNCPHAFMFDKIDDLQMNGLITDSEAQTIKSKLMMGQSESLKLDAYLQGFNIEMGQTRFITGNGYRPCNVISSLSQNRVVSIDIGSVSNMIMLNTIIYQLNLAQRKGIQYMLIVDSIPVDTNDSFSKLMKTPSRGSLRTIVSEDLYSMTGGDEKLFSAMVGDAGIIVVMQHYSGQSAMKWAETFGQYDKYEESYSTNNGRSREPFKLFSSHNSSSSVSIAKTRSFIVQPEQISRLGNGEAYVISAALGQIAHFVFID